MNRKIYLPMAVFFIFVICILLGVWFLLARPMIQLTSESRDPDFQVAPEQLRSHVMTLSVDMAPRSYTDINNLGRVVEYIGEAFKSAGARVRLQEFQAAGNVYRNVIATFGPERGEVIVVGAHYDTAGQLPGADDNASGIAGLIELARLVGQLKPTRKVELVAFALEEPPFFNTDSMGSTVFAKSLHDAKVEVQVMIALEMIGYFSDEPGSQQYPISLLKLFYPDKGNFIAVVDELFSSKGGGIKRVFRSNTDLPVHSINAPRFIPGVDLSDHKSFWRYGYPAVMITDTAFFRNKAYHTPADTADRLNYEKMAQVVYGVFAYIREIGALD